MPTDDTTPTPPHDSPSNIARLLRGHRRRDLVIGVLGALVVALLILGVTAARNGPSSRSAPAAVATTTPGAALPATFVVTGSEPNGTAPPTQAVVDAVVAQLDTWANAGLVDPLRRGTEAPPLAELFTETARPPAATTDRLTLFVVGVPKSEVVVDTATARLHTVAGPDAGTAVVVAEVDLRLTARAGAQRLAITRAGEIVLVPESDGVWRIDGWRLHAAEEPL